MRDDRDTEASAARGPSARLIVVRAPAGTGKTEMIRRWTASLTDTVVICPDVTPDPESAVSFWMRLITQLHSRGLISDDHLFRAATGASRNETSRRTAIGQLLATIEAVPTLIVDDLQSAIPAEAYGQVIDDISYLLSVCPHMRVVVIECERSPIDDLDFPGQIMLGAHHVPPVALFSGRRIARDPSPPLRELIRDDQLLEAMCLAALPRTIGTELVRELTGRDGQELLRAAHDHRLGTWIDAPDGRAHFEFRSSVRAEARAELHRAWPQDKIAAAQILARQHLAQSENDLAFEFAVIAGDVPLIDRIGLRLAPFAKPLPGRTAERLARLPIARIRESAVLSLWAAAQSDLTLQPNTSTIDLYSAAAAAAQRDSADLDTTDGLILNGIECFAARRAGDTVHAIESAERFHARSMEHLRTDRLDESLAAPFVEFAYQASVALLLGDARVAAADLLVEVEKLGRRHGLEYRHRSAQAALGFLHTLDGRLREAADLTRMASAYTGRGGHGDNSFVAFLHMSDLLRAAMKADFVRLQRAVASLGDGRAHAAHWDLRLLGDILLDLATGNRAAARVRFDSTVRAHLEDDSPGASQHRVAYLHGVLTLFGEAPHLARSPSATDTPAPIALALSAARDVDVDDLGQAADKLRSATAQASSPFTHHVTLVVLARLGVARGNTASVRSTAAHLLTLMRTHGLRIGFALLDEHERETILASLSNTREMRVAFAAITPMTRRSSATSVPVLTRRQLVVIRALAELGDRRAVAGKLFLSPGTIKAHLRAIYKKLGAHSETEALRNAAALGLLTTRAAFGADPRNL